jgi:HTH-type transcriptional regulator / antitoxin HipB
MSPIVDTRGTTMRLRTPRDVGLVIRARRRALGLEQQALADRVGVSRQWVVGVEKGKQRAEAGLVLKTLTALGLVLDVREDHAVEASPSPGAPTPSDIDAVVAAARRKPK